MKMPDACPALFVPNKLKIFCYELIDDLKSLIQKFSGQRVSL